VLAELQTYIESLLYVLATLIHVQWRRPKRFPEQIMRCEAKMSRIRSVPVLESWRPPGLGLGPSPENFLIFLHKMACSGTL